MSNEFGSNRFRRRALPSYTLWLVGDVRPVGEHALSRAQRLTTWMAAVTVMIGSLGVPLSTQRVAKSGPAFPCQDCPCGCSDAETCWRDCCCFTNRQKVVWAEKNGVKVPLFVTVAARREQAQSAPQSNCCSEQVACDKRDQTDCCNAASTKSAVSSCCQKRHAQTRNTESKLVLLMTALKCRGISVSVGLLPPSLPPALETLAVDAVEIETIPIVASPRYQPPCHDVATPPPDACALLAS